jgi:hypothetical protein
VRPEALGQLGIALDLALGVVLEVAVALEAALDELAEFGREPRAVEEVVHSEAGARGFGRVGGADALFGGADGGAAELGFLEAVDDLVKVEDEVGAVRDEEARGAGQTFGFEGLELGKERGNVDDDAWRCRASARRRATSLACARTGADEADAVRIREPCAESSDRAHSFVEELERTGRQQVEGVLDLFAGLLDDDGVAGVVAAGAAGADVDLRALPFSSDAMTPS